MGRVPALTPPPPATGTASTKRDALIDTALELFNGEGYRAVGIDTLLQKAGVAKMTLYKHFRSKEELISAVLERRGAAIAAEILARVEGVSPEAPDPARERLLAVFDWLEDWLRSPTFHGCLFVKAAGEYPHSDELPRRAAESFKSTCRDLLESLCAELGAPRPVDLARQLELLIEGAAAVAYLHREPSAASAAKQAAALLIDAARRLD